MGKKKEFGRIIPFWESLTPAERGKIWDSLLEEEAVDLIAKLPSLDEARLSSLTHKADVIVKRAQIRRIK